MTKIDTMVLLMMEIFKGDDDDDGKGYDGNSNDDGDDVLL